MTIEYTEDRSLDTDNTLGGNSPSDYKKPSQKAVQNFVKNYVDNKIGNIETILHNINSGT